MSAIESSATPLYTEKRSWYCSLSTWKVRTSCYQVLHFKSWPDMGISYHTKHQNNIDKKVIICTFRPNSIERLLINVFVFKVALLIEDRVENMKF